MAEPTVLIIGAGTFGISTAYHLAQTYEDPSRVTVIDRRCRISSPSTTDRAAAIDVNRIIRTDYVSPLYCNLANEAIHDWFWSKELGHFFHKTGWIVLDQKDNNFTKSVRRTFQLRGSDYTEDVDCKDLGKQFGFLQGLNTNLLGNGYFNPEAGWCDAASATANFMAAAEAKGVNMITGEVTELLFDFESRKLAGVMTTTGQKLTADKIVIAAGAWTSNLVSPVEEALGLVERDRIENQVKAVGRLSAYYTLSAEETNHLCEVGLPVLAYAGWGILTPPSHDNRILKINDLRTEFVNTITMPSGSQISVPSDQGQFGVSEKLKKEGTKLLDMMVPLLEKGRSPDRWRICWDAKTPTGDWLLCKHPYSELQNLFLAVGGNFNSYKFLPIAGKYMCNVLNERSNGAEKDKAWCWKKEEALKNSDPKEIGSVARATALPELKSFEDGTRPRL
ncbi:L-pipecolate oxidase 2 [Colletotrichum truncatum]|uniref:L-pipecolate oxidase 2 n=1 Tax=Colletotrichum truncatum TaxID=5467 RepID=A0ACC3YYJ5_COLTU|nr:L-pipecolate oxidase 2 [Colletotrichum truncatum]KAF6782011.1 L-pipecolate oxidase 2 [Colletotrichum truncatum]